MSSGQSGYERFVIILCNKVDDPDDEERGWTHCRSSLEKWKRSSPSAVGDGAPQVLEAIQVVDSSIVLVKYRQPSFQSQRYIYPPECIADGVLRFKGLTRN
jgi:hypothetical protein